MKKLLIALTSLTTLTIAGNSIIVINNNNNNARIKTENTNDAPETPLFNYQYGLLSADPIQPENTWITNQSSKDHKIYSYDLSHVMGRTLLSDKKTKAETVFMVNEYGNLDYNRVISESDKEDLNNSITEMNDDRIVTTIKDDYNPYSCSKYVDSGHFADQTGTNTWQYLQQGQAEPNIDISQVKNAQNIAHNNAESEALGLYYIAKQYRASEKMIDLAVAKEIAETFIAKSNKLKDLNKDLIDQIITLIAKNDNVFNFILNTPFHIAPTYRNCTLNYVFDKNNHLIEIYYNALSKDNADININYQWSDSYSGTQSAYDHSSADCYIINNITSYTKTWSDFIAKYPTLIFANDAKFSGWTTWGGGQQDNLTISLINLPDHLDMSSSTWWNSNTPVWHFVAGSEYGNGWNSQFIEAWMFMWHDAKSIYFKWRVDEDSCWETQAASFSLIMNHATLINVMN